MTEFTQAAPRKIINFDIEALRGFAALYVVWDHSQVFQYYLDPAYVTTGIWSYVAPGHFCVLIFFVLSGYVIGISNKRPLTWTTSLEYLKKRLVRLYPIFFIALAFALLVSPQHFGVATIIGNLAMLQGLYVIDINQPGWSLHYEMLYYLLFIVVSIFRLNPFIIAAGALVVALGNFALYSTLHTPIITSYSYGLIFWILGLGLSRVLGNAKLERPSYQVMLSCLFFILCIDQFNLFDTLMHKAVTATHLNVIFPKDIYSGQRQVQIYDLSYLPFALLIILVFIGKHIPYRLGLLRGLFAFSAINLLYVAKHAYSGDLDYATYTLPTIFLLVALVCLFLPSAKLEKVGQQVVKVGIWLGSLSYGIYLVHFPLLLLFNRITFFSGTWQTFAVRFGLLMLLTVGIGYWLEKVMQPWVKSFFFKNAPVIVPEPGPHSKLVL